MQKEFYHTLEQYTLAEIEPFLKHAQEYIKGKRTVPVSQTSIEKCCETVLFTFSDSLLEMFVTNQDSLKKPYEVAIKYGFRGHSNGGINGIVYQKDEDTDMTIATERLVRENKAAVLKDLDITEEDLQKLRKVKIVWHNPSGNRIVGVYLPEKKQMIFLDFAQY